MTMRDMLIFVIRKKGGDGLVNVSEECGCGVDDLCPCDYPDLDHCILAKWNEKRGEYWPYSSLIWDDAE